MSLIHRIRQSRELLLSLALLCLGACAGVDCGSVANRAEPAAHEETEEAEHEHQEGEEHPHQEVDTAAEGEPAEEPDTDHDHYSDESGDHALEVHPIHGHSATSVSQEKERAIGGRLGVPTLPIVEPPAAE